MFRIFLFSQHKLNMQIIFLGSGCGIPTLKRNHPSIWMDYRGDRFLWDCGEGTQRQILKARLPLMKISKIFITHWHADHFAGLLPLIETLHLSRKKKPLEVYAPEASRFIDALVELSYWGIGFEINAHDCNEDKKIEKIFENEFYEIYAIKVIHSVPASGYVFKERDSWNIDVKKAKKFNLSGIQMKKIKEKGKLKVKNKIIKLEQTGGM